MTFNLDGFNITIMAKKTEYSDGRRADLATLLTRLACHEWSARELNKSQGYHGIASENMKYAMMFSDMADKLREVEA